MPLDFKLIENNIDHSKSQLIKKTSTGCPYLYLLNDFFDRTMLDKILNYLKAYDKWGPSEPYYEGRQILNWEFDTVVEEIHISMESLTSEVNTLFNTNHSKFLGLNIWKDEYPFIIPKHTDNPIIGTSIQIYLNDCEENLATKFFYENETLNIPYISNSGYAMNNDFRIFHSMDSKIPLGFERYSLYAIWGA